MNKVRWVKEYEYAEATVEVFENGSWKIYKSSSVYKPDGDYSKGFATFINALKHGYLSEGLYIRSK